MAKSETFSAIRADVLKITNAVPRGKVTTFGNIGSYMSVAPRHVAYILSQLSPEEQDEIAWHRVVGESGNLGKPKHNARGQSQSELLRQEDVAINDGKLLNFNQVFISVEETGCNIQPGRIYSR